VRSFFDTDIDFNPIALFVGHRLSKREVHIQRLVRPIICRCIQHPPTFPVEGIQSPLPRIELPSLILSFLLL
jgi:hypothetical protein